MRRAAYRLPMSEWSSDGCSSDLIGGPSFGARHNACNEGSDIAGLVEFARRYHARVFTTINTILHDDELEPARALIHQLYDAGVEIGRAACRERGWQYV